MPGMDRRALLDKFQGMVARREPIIGGGAGTGLSAKCEEAGGIDLIVIYNSGRYRMAGRGSLAGLLAYGNANEIVKEMAREVIPVVSHTPVLAGVNGTDPFLVLDQFLGELKALGFSGVQNFPTVGLIDGVFRANLEETGMGFGLEVEMIRAAHAADLLTTPYVFSERNRCGRHGRGRRRHHRLPHGPHDERQYRRPDGEVAGRMRAADRCVGFGRFSGARAVREDVIVLCHGGPSIASPEDATYILQNATQVHGFYGASSMERLPTEVAMTAQTKAFKAVGF